VRNIEMAKEMTGKRKREGKSVSGSSTPGRCRLFECGRDWVLISDITGSKDANGTAKPLSAVAAARLKAQQIVAASAGSLDAPSSPVSESAPSEVSEAEAQEEEFPVTQQRNVQLCTWRYGKDYISSESDSEITVSLKKGVTITLIGIFDFAVLKGAININGANLEAKAGRGEKPIVRRAFVPSTHPLSIIRGLDGTNEVRFLDCGDAMPLEELSPLFRDIWNAKSGKGGSRSFALVSLILFSFSLG
jgi:polynucleotide 5'-hydroxyl-kinase GRC3/NOL9